METIKTIPALIIYGSLAPGESNHVIMDPIKGEWKKATIKGKFQDLWYYLDLGK